ncbi:Hsp33 family molecular chaperone HslO [Lentisphaera profundi]|uniref:Hsp33 family molecular chaperone HslO n=1 Tax=Lentisphaera profundi TaxID=1658616 RepID=A0ABY7VTT0_9BACT|nr:Hsp33 family molecular chaperone HslO [Lentisphaera profundi]WDE96159.1 Hsp33 family molecular chaperone HslO [Lentisphaera profundi]
MNDFLYRGIVEGLNARFSAVHATKAVETGIIKHNCDPVSGLLLCRALGTGLLISPLLQDDHRFTISWQYDGPIGKMVVDVGANSDVRGLITNTNLATATASVAQAYGENGQISVVRSSSKILISSSTTEAQLLELSDDLGFFFSTSEQVETELTVATNFRPDPENPVSLCQGFLLQALPGCDLEKLDRARQRMKSAAFRDLLDTAPELDNHVEKLIQLLFDEDESNQEYSIHSCPTPVFQCNCSKEKTFGALRTLNLEELIESRDKKEEIAVSCHFCSTRYSFDHNDLQILIDEKS